MRHRPSLNLRCQLHPHPIGDAAVREYTWRAQEQFQNSQLTPCRMRPAACSVTASNGTPKTVKAAARLHLHSGLENRRTLIASPGFESLVSRQDLHKSLAKAGLLRFWGLMQPSAWGLIVSASFQTVSATPHNSPSASRFVDEDVGEPEGGDHGVTSRYCSYPSPYSQQ